MSRAKFEEWYEAHVVPAESDWFKRDADGYYVLPFVAHAWDGWLAGRESMRDEAAILCEGRAVIHYDYLSDECTSPQEISDLESHECAAAIRSIEP